MAGFSNEIESIYPREERIYNAAAAEGTMAVGAEITALLFIGLAANVPAIVTVGLIVGGVYLFRRMLQNVDKVGLMDPKDPEYNPNVVSTPWNPVSPYITRRGAQR